MSAPLRYTVRPGYELEMAYVVCDGGVPHTETQSEAHARRIADQLNEEANKAPAAPGGSQ